MKPNPLSALNHLTVPVAVLVLRAVVPRTRRKPRQPQRALARCQPEPTARAVRDDNNHGLGGARSGKLGHGVPVAPDAHDILLLAGCVHIKDLFAPVVEDGDDDALAAWQRLADLYLAIASVGGSPT